MPAFFRATVSDFLATSTAQGLDRLTAGLAAQGFDLTPDQRAAWVEEWPRLQSTLRSLSEVQQTFLNWALLLEYPIPGRQKRIDAVLLTPNGIIVVEFKSGGRYRYQGVPEHIYSGLIRAPSAGRYLNQWIKDRYGFRKLS